MRRPALVTLRSSRRLVTADELEPYRDGDGFLRLALTAEINGEVVGTDLLSNMSWTFEEMTAYASRGTYVRPGDVLGSGTCGNGGCLAELWGVRGRQDPPPLKPGDTVTLTVEGIGTVANTVVAGAGVIGRRLAGVDLSDDAAVRRAPDAFEAPASHTVRQSRQASNLGRLFHHAPAALQPIRDAVLESTPLMQKVVGESTPGSIRKHLREIDEAEDRFTELLGHGETHGSGP